MAESQQERESYLTTVLGREFVVHPGVFSPKYFHDTAFFAEHLPVSEGGRVLEIGAGTGAIAITAAYKGASHVLAVDINPASVVNTAENVGRHAMESRVEVRQGDLFDTLTPEECFDLIFWNTPFGLVEIDEKLSDLERAVYDPDYAGTERFIKEAPLYLAPDGKIVIGFSSTLGKIELLRRFVKEAGLEFRLIASTQSMETHPVQFELFECQRSTLVL